MSFLEKLKSIKVWRSGDHRAPHKPLLILLALAKFLNHVNQIPYKEIKEKLSELLNNFGPPNAKGPHYPFWRLKNDGIWSLSNTENIKENPSGDVSDKTLLENNVSGSFTTEILTELKNSPTIVNESILFLLENNFPETLHNDILMALGIELNQPRLVDSKSIRDPKFREKILVAYNYMCAICKFDLRLNLIPIALEAAHIKWHMAGGPDKEINGLALCVMHHKLFDRGAFTLNENLCVQISGKISGQNGLDEFLFKYENKPIHLPRKQLYRPSEQFIQWHCKEVFHDYKIN